MQATKTDSIFRLTALWAFAECSLGGVMHAFKIPLTGIFVGGFAVLCIGLLAHLSGRNAAVILRSTLLVVLVKAIVSPHSPPQAYLAVTFQGVFGALVLCNLRPFALAAYLFGLVSLVESALQKLLVLLLFFGKSLFEAFDVFVTDVLEIFGIQSQVSWSKIAVGSYLSLYAVVGLALGLWITKLPGQLERKSAEYSALSLPTENVTLSFSKKSDKKWLLLLAVLAFIVLTFLLAGGKASGGQKALYAVARTLAALAAWFFFLQPVVTFFFKKWTKRRSEAEKGNLLQIMEFFPDLRAKVRPLYRHVSEKYKGWRRLREFVVALFAVAIYGE
jgi:hypothetical protein